MEKELRLFIGITIGLILGLFIGYLVYCDPKYKYDLNNDGKVDVLDMLRLQKYINGDVK